MKKEQLHWQETKKRYNDRLHTRYCRISRTLGCNTSAHSVLLLTLLSSTKGIYYTDVTTKQAFQ